MNWWWTKTAAYFYLMTPSEEYRTLNLFSKKYLFHDFRRWLENVRWRDIRTMEKERREALRVLFEGQQVANQSPALMLGAPVGAQAGSGGGQGDFSTWGACSLLLPSPEALEQEDLIVKRCSPWTLHWVRINIFGVKEQNHTKGYRSRGL